MTRVNLEVDLVARYLERMQTAGDASGRATPEPTPKDFPMTLATTSEILADFKAGRMVILIDEEDRENEGDLVLSADFVTPDAINFMARHARGLICLTLTEARCRQLQLPLMTAVNGTRNRHEFHDVDRGGRRRDDRHLGRRPGADDPGRGRAGGATGRTSSDRATCSRSWPAKAAC